MRKRLTYANVVATLALVFAMSGGALAASHYLINSTKQISPKVLRKLKGATGKTGKTGPAGTPGAAGKEGVQGKEGQQGKPGVSTITTLASGQSESGGFAAGGGYDAGLKGEEKEDFGYIGTDITFPQPLAHPIEEKHIIDVQGGAGTTAPHCPGVGKAEAGYLCLYNTTPQDIETGYGYSNESEFSVPEPGVQIFWAVKEAGEPYSGGEWTVTAP